ncbi:MAG: shikimate kinase [Sphingosinicella sp.]|uniref:shikimate kinase n=1 Tax=Sphingosinicella sp. TaxID=1917971 RepID=UPI004037BE1A
MPDPVEASVKSIALVGLMGVGKSTIGWRLARRLGLPFVDADAEIEAAAGLSIAEIFDRFGEAHFRDAERRVIARLVVGPRHVIATGGGAFMNEQTRALILAHCVAIWLDADVEALAERVARDPHRPLLKGNDPRALLRSLARVRNPAYAEAHLTIRSDADPQRTVDLILEALADR